jgi:hypothetical protein
MDQSRQKETTSGRDRPGQYDASRRQPGEDRAQPHAIANELTAEPTLQSSARRPVDLTDPAIDPDRAAMRQPGDQPPRDKALTQTQKNVGRQMMIVVAVALVGGLVLATILLRNWILLGLGLLVIVPFMIMVMAPYWMAASTKVAQDQTVRDQRGQRPSDR